MPSAKPLQKETREALANAAEFLARMKGPKVDYKTNYELDPIETQHIAFIPVTSCDDLLLRLGLLPILVLQLSEKRRHWLAFYLVSVSQ